MWLACTYLTLMRVDKKTASTWEAHRRYRSGLEDEAEQEASGAAAGGGAAAVEPAESYYLDNTPPVTPPTTRSNSPAPANTSKRARAAEEPAISE